MSGVINGEIIQTPERESSNNAAGLSNSSDEEIYCPICNYNLTGILTGRCPECGSLFDRESLIASQKANRITLIPWDDPAETEFWPRFKKTLAICLFDAKRFAFAFSVQPQESRANSFRTIVTLGVCVLSLITIASCIPFYWLFLDYRRAADQIISIEALIFLLTLVGVLVATILTTTLATALVLGIFCPHFDGKRHFKPWMSISSYASAHYLLLPVGLPLFVFLVWWSRELFGAGIVLGFLMMGLACGLLNAFTLNAVVRHRGANTSGRSFAMFAVFLIYAVSILVIPGCIAAVVFVIVRFFGI
jgi:hypothetical protein